MKNKILLQQMPGLSLYESFMCPNFSWRKHMNKNIPCGGIPKKIDREQRQFLNNYICSSEFNML